MHSPSSWILTGFWHLTILVCRHYPFMMCLEPVISNRSCRLSYRKGRRIQSNLANSEPALQALGVAASLQAGSPSAAQAKDAAQQTIETLGGGQEVISAAPKGGLTPLGLIAVFSPVILYGIFSIIRSTLNPRLKVLFFLALLHSIAILACSQVSCSSHEMFRRAHTSSKRSSSWTAPLSSDNRLPIHTHEMMIVEKE